jgi:hypothetical protein
MPEDARIRTFKSKGGGVKSVVRPWTKLGAASVVAAVIAAIPGPSAAEQPIQVFLLAGQSNMVGRGLPISDGTGPAPGLLQWRDDAWVPADDPLGPPGDPESGVGPGMTFGIGVLGHEPPGTTIGVIMCARGGSSIRDWRPGESIYNKCRRVARAAGGQIAGIVFLQGETEAAKPNGGEVWATGFGRTERAFEREFGPVPFVLGQIGSLDPERAPYQQAVRDAQTAAAAAHPEVALVTSTDLPLQDALHFTADAEKTLGTRFADAWYALSLRIPTLANVSPNSGLAGSTVTITGSGFDIATSVQFGSVRADFQVDSNTTITATVPDSAVTGALTLSTPLGIVTDSSPFGIRPTVGSFAPDSGTPGTIVMVNGQTFRGTTLVALNGVPAKFRVLSRTLLKLRVPSAATSGAISVTNAGGTTSSAGTFTVPPPSP